MYLRAAHAESSIPILRQLIRKFPLGILTTAISSPTYPLIQSSHIPWVLDVEDDESETELGTLRGHMARANPQSKSIIESFGSTEGPSPPRILEQEVLVLFNSPTHHYVTPKFYVETKPTTAKVVPTWNYAAVQAYGKAKIYFDSKAEETGSFLSTQINDLSHQSETNIMGYTGQNGQPKEWTVDQAPDAYVNILKKNIIGIEIKLERLEGKFKMSQEMGAGDREGVIKGFKELGSEIGSDIADLVEERGRVKDNAKAR